MLQEEPRIAEVSKNERPKIIQSLLQGPFQWKHPYGDRSAGSLPHSAPKHQPRQTFIPFAQRRRSHWVARPSPTAPPPTFLGGFLSFYGELGTFLVLCKKLAGVSEHFVFCRHHEGASQNQRRSAARSTLANMEM